MLDPKTDRVLADVSREIQQLLGARLITVALYGSAAGPDYVPGLSDLNLAAVVDILEHAQLEALRSRTSAWRKRRVATPLVMDREFLRRAADVFPLELHEIREQHRLLWGEDVFGSIEVHDEHLRYQCEHEARGKLLRLRELYLEIGSRRRQMETLLLDSLKTFLIIMRTVNRMRGEPSGLAYERVLETFCRRSGCTLPTVSALLQIRQGRMKWHGQPDEVFRRYSEELGRVVDVVDRLFHEGAAPRDRS